MTAAADLRSFLDHVLGSGATRIVVDLADVTFIDSSGLGALTGGLKKARQAGGDRPYDDLAAATQGW